MKNTFIVLIQMAFKLDIVRHFFTLSVLSADFVYVLLITSKAGLGIGCLELTQCGVKYWLELSDG